jgi:hypothetical protein
MADLTEVQSSLAVKIAGANPSTGVEDNYAEVDATGALRVDPTGTTVQPVSGTVTANAGTGTFAVAPQGVVDSNNSSTAALSAFSTFIGTATDVTNYGMISVSAYLQAGGSLTIEFSPDGANWASSNDALTLSGGTTYCKDVTPKARYMRVLLSSLSGSSNPCRLQTILKPSFGPAAIVMGAQSFGGAENNHACVMISEPSYPSFDGGLATRVLSLPLASGAATSAKQPALGTAGSASSDVITVQGISSMTPLKVDGSAHTQPVSGTFWQATQPVSGTFWQATQPVSAVSLPLPTGAATAARQPAFGLSGAASADVLSVQGVSGMTALQVDGSAVTQPISGSVTVPLGVAITDGVSNTVAVKAASTAAVATDKALVVAVSPNNGLALNATQTDGTQLSRVTDGTTTASVFPATFLRVTDEPTQIFYDPFESFDTTNRWTAVNSGGGAAPAVTNGVLTVGSGTTASGYASATSKPTFTPTVPSWLGISFALSLESPIGNNAHRFWGIATSPGTPTTSAPITNGIGFEVDTAGKMYCVYYNSGVRAVIQDLSAATGNGKQPTDSNNHRYIVMYRTDKTYFYIDGLAASNLVSTANFAAPASQVLPVKLQSVADSSAPASSRIITCTGLAVWDTGKNNFTLSDGTLGWRKATVVPASTAAAATDTALVVAVSPNTGVSLGTSTGKTVVMKTGSLVTTAVTADQVILTYTVTSGKTFYLCYVDCIARLTTYATTATNFGTFSLETPGGTKVYTGPMFNAGAFNPTRIEIAEGIPIPASTVIRVVCTPAATTSYTWWANFGGYEK